METIHPSCTPGICNLSPGKRKAGANTETIHPSYAPGNMLDASYHLDHLVRLWWKENDRRKQTSTRSLQSYLNFPPELPRIPWPALGNNRKKERNGLAANPKERRDL